MTMLRSSRVLACAVLLGMAASLPARANFTCSGQISYLGLDYSGSLNVSVGFGIWNICSFTSTSSNGGISIQPETCGAWYAAILASKKAGEPVMLYLTSSANTANGPECSAIGSWVVPSPLPYFLNVL